MFAECTIQYDNNRKKRGRGGGGGGGWGDIYVFVEKQILVLWFLSWIATKVLSLHCRVSFACENICHLNSYSLIKTQLHHLLRAFKVSKWAKIWAVSSEEVPPSMRKMCEFTSSCTCAKSHPGICSSLIHTIFNDSVCGQRSPWSDYAKIQADLGFRCPHMSEDTFSHASSFHWTVIEIWWINVFIQFALEIRQI